MIKSQFPGKNFSLKAVHFLFLSVFFIGIVLPVSAQTQRNVGNSLTTGSFQDFSSPQSVTAFPAIPIKNGPPEKSNADIATDTLTPADVTADSAVTADVTTDTADTADATKDTADTSDATTDTADTSDATTDTAVTADATTDTAVTPEDIVQPAKIKKTAIQESNKNKKPKYTVQLLVKDYSGMTLLGVNAFYEIGRIDKLQERLDDLKDSLTKDARISRLAYKDKFKDINNFLELMEKEAYAQVHARVNLFTPVVFTSTILTPSTWTFEAAVIGGVGLSFVKNGEVKIDSPVLPECESFLDTGEFTPDCRLKVLAQLSNPEFNCDGLSVTDITADITIEKLADCNIFKLNSNAYADLKTYTGAVLKLGYSTHLMNTNFGSPYLDSSIFLGLNYRMNKLDISGINYFYKNYDKEDDIQKILNKNKKAVTINDFEIGALMVSKYYQIGLGLDHLLSPSVPYTNGNVKLKLNPYILASIYNPFDTGRSLSLNFYQDIGFDTSLTGAEYKWRTVSFTYSPERFYIPDIRIGKRYNLTGSKLEYTQIGLTLLNFLNFNYAFTEEKVKVDKSTTVPRSAFINVSLDINI